MQWSIIQPQKGMKYWNVGETGEQSVKWKKTVTKDYILYNSTYMKFTD